jgi:hypothetical protein
VELEHRIHRDEHHEDRRISLWAVFLIETLPRCTTSRCTHDADPVSQAGRVIELRFTVDRISRDPDSKTQTSAHGMFHAPGNTEVVPAYLVQSQHFIPPANQCSAEDHPRRARGDQCNRARWPPMDGAAAALRVVRIPRRRGEYLGQGVRTQGA